jgi:hypothetical protein
MIRDIISLFILIVVMLLGIAVFSEKGLFIDVNGTTYHIRIR